MPKHRKTLKENDDMVDQKRLKEELVQKILEDEHDAFNWTPRFGDDNLCKLVGFKRAKSVLPLNVSLNCGLCNKYENVNLVLLV